MFSNFMPFIANNGFKFFFLWVTTFTKRCSIHTKIWNTRCSTTLVRVACIFILHFSIGFREVDFDSFTKCNTPTEDSFLAPIPNVAGKGKSSCDDKPKACKNCSCGRKELEAQVTSSEQGFY